MYELFVMYILSRYKKGRVQIWTVTFQVFYSILLIFQICKIHEKINLNVAM